ncbi:hypothetical protein MJO29_010446 [Puccinia striiformis f. sp. tritici]|uniref:Uncharacterized protein n=1 Tax=Puccinia striiformis f. sp. tritici PST-78 TaxID=1165861 RepID=A0A0L0W1W9_9BASI|nr:hypothetical protein Pst134EA_019523 [Puccinia striiformis f. sp. tritici]KAI9610600.1 hypothetical protein H4Q26_006746 [Puccinia striiformis f. sp. tritici PST-130]KNF05280.1 hypothetical protein PSTG_01495 [Puccinia striiformis f. sp. tritici PST-78]KAH9449585.1 hypothetical protein Pst134EB_020405 [Puccinia striiformis f. sp. tritici]KAH9459371.1 hypothetical protein Pst134EA_019523 [Puccinia striiformis f. sp. tritici]KAI7948781.1 hypothetical protein MJO29_010446 [Puccinia striiformis
MDPHSAAAFYRMKLFLADLNHVLGAVIPLKDRPTFNYANSKNSSSGCRTTQRSRAWKRSRLPRMKPQIEGFKSQHTPRTCVVRLPLCTRPIESTYKEDQPEYDTQNVGRSESQFRQAPHCPHASEPEQQYLEGPHSNEPDQQYFEGDGCFERYTDGFNDVNNSLEDSAANDDPENRQLIWDMMANLTLSLVPACRPEARAVGSPPYGSVQLVPLPPSWAGLGKVNYEIQP